MLKGITVSLFSKAEDGIDDFNRPIYKDVQIDVEDVLVHPLSDEEVANTLNLTGRRAIYELGIPKGDSNDWVNAEVVFFGKKFRTIGEPTEGIDFMIPLRWNKKVKVEIVNGK